MYIFFLLFTFETTEICLECTKMKISTGKKHFTPGTKSGNNFAPAPPPNIPHTLLLKYMKGTISRKLVKLLSYTTYFFCKAGDNSINRQDIPLFIMIWWNMYNYGYFSHVSSDRTVKDSSHLGKKEKFSQLIRPIHSLNPQHHESCFYIIKRQSHNLFLKFVLCTEMTQIRSIHDHFSSTNTLSISIAKLSFWHIRLVMLRSKILHGRNWACSFHARILWIISWIFADDTTVFLSDKDVNVLYE